MSEERCLICDRQKATRSMGWPMQGVCFRNALDCVPPSKEELAKWHCDANAVDWRARALAAEAKLREQHEALLEMAAIAQLRGDVMRSDATRMPCGHLQAEVVCDDKDEGTSYCAGCEREARGRDDAMHANYRKGWNDACDAAGRVLYVGNARTTQLRAIAELRKGE